MKIINTLKFMLFLETINCTIYCTMFVQPNWWHLLSNTTYCQWGEKKFTSIKFIYPKPRWLSNSELYILWIL